MAEVKKRVALPVIVVIIVIAIVGVAYALRSDDKGSSKPNNKAFCTNVQSPISPEKAFTGGPNVGLMITLYRNSREGVPRAVKQALRAYIAGLERLKDGAEVATVQADPKVQAAIATMTEYANRRCPKAA